VKIALVQANGDVVDVELPHHRVLDLDLAVEDNVWVYPRQVRIFVNGKRASPTEKSTPRPLNGPKRARIVKEVLKYFGCFLEGRWESDRTDNFWRNS
jgi:hypothetical protein